MVLYMIHDLLLPHLLMILYTYAQIRHPASSPIFQVRGASYSNLGPIPMAMLSEVGENHHAYCY